MQLSLTVPQCFLGLFSLCHVAADGHDARLSLMLDERGARFHPAPDAVPIANSPDKALSVPGEDAVPPLPATIEVFRVGELEKIDRLLCVKPVDLRAPVNAPGLRVVHANKVIRILRQQTVKFLT